LLTTDYTPDELDTDGRWGFGISAGRRPDISMRDLRSGRGRSSEIELRDPEETGGTSRTAREERGGTGRGDPGNGIG